MRHKKIENFAPVLSGILVAVALVFIGWWFATATQEKALRASNKITVAHNEIAQLPQPADIDLGVPSGSIMEQLERYQRAIQKYENLSFNHPSTLRLRLAGWIGLDHAASPAIEPATLADKYETFMDTYSQLISALEKPLVYDPESDLHGLDQESEEFKQRINRARSGLSVARTLIGKHQIPVETKDKLTRELTTWGESIETLNRGNKLQAWSEQVDASQKEIQNTLQTYWADSIASLSSDKQKLTTYYIQLYQ